MNVQTIDNFIAGNFVASRKYIDSYEPATGEVLVKIPDSGKLEAEAAVTAASRAFPQWSALSAEKRGEYLVRVADLLEKKADEFAKAESRDQGKPLRFAATVDVPLAAKIFRHYAYAIPHMMETSKMRHDPKALCFTMRVPVGVAGLIIPWNFPLYLISFKLAAALSCGNTVVAKPSEMTSLTAFMMCKLLKEAGIPDGVANVVFGLGPSVGEAIINHPKVTVISFTGSTATGRKIAVAGAPMFKRISLEMGGKNAAILFKDCDLSAACDGLLRSCFFNQGEVCICTSRVFVHKDIMESFLEEFVAKTRGLKVGDPEDPETFVGAMNSSVHLEKVKSYLKLIKEEGGKILCGEGVDQLRLGEKNKNGYFLQPTIVTGLKDSTRCMQEEIFGPIACVTPFDNEEEVIERANGTEYGLAASVWTKNIDTAHRVASKLDVGSVWTNGWMVVDEDLPFGGFKGSGIGREGTKYSYEFFTEVKAIYDVIN